MQNAGCGVVTGRGITAAQPALTLSQESASSQQHSGPFQMPLPSCGFLVALTAVGSAGGYQLQLQPSKLVLPHKVRQ